MEDTKGRINRIKATTLTFLERKKKTNEEGALDFLEANQRGGKKERV